MLLTKDDLGQIKTIVNDVVTDVVTDKISGLATKVELHESISALKSDLDRMESRLTTAIGLLQRDSYSRLDDHDARIARLEQARSH
jgi:hypothetical protein